MQRSPQKEYLSVVVLGHVDAGKSTLTGHFMYLTGCVSDEQMKQYEKQSLLLGKGSFKYAWVVNKLKAERQRGITIEKYHNRIETATRQFNFINTPGHRDFMKNTIAGINLADCGILMVAVPLGQFEAGISYYGQTKQHALLAYTFGIRQLVVCCNKLDYLKVKYSEGRYIEVKDEMLRILKKIGYDPNKITFVPISAWEGDNLTNPSEKMPWYNGPTFLQAIKSLQLPKHNTDKPLRFSVENVFKIAGKGTVVTGRVITGILKPGTNLIDSRTKCITEVGSIERHHIELQEALAGGTVGVHLKNISTQDLRRGDVLGAVGNLSGLAKSFVAHIIVINHPGQIMVGYTPVLSCHEANVACRINTIFSKIDKSNGKVIEQQPKSLKQGDAAIVEFVPTKPLYVEVFQEFPPLGRFAVRDMKATVAVGVVKSIQRFSPMINPT